MEYLGILLVGAAALCVGWLLLYILYRLLIEREDKYQTLQSQISEAQAARTREKVRALNRRDMAEFHRLDKEDVALTAVERAILVDARTVIDERTAQELDLGINPYARPTRAARLRAAKAKR